MPTARLPRIDVEIETEAGELPASSPILADLAEALLRLHLAIPIRKFECERVSVVPLEYAYRIEAADGRRWQQRVLFEPPTSDPWMSFEVADLWRESEFGPHRRLRSFALQAVVGFKATLVRACVGAELEPRPAPPAPEPAPDKPPPDKPPGPPIVPPGLGNNP